MDKSIFNEAIPTSEQKALLKQRIFETYTEKTENKTAKVFPFKQIAAIAAAFVLVVGAVALLTVLAGLGGTGIDVSYTPHDSNSVPIGVEYEKMLREKYPQYFDVDTTKGLVVYVWQMTPKDYSCALVTGKNIGYIDSDIETLPGAAISEMKAILKTYDIDSSMISVMPFYHSLSSYMYEINDDYVTMLREKLGLKVADQDEWGISVSTSFKNETQFTLTIAQTLPDGMHLSGELT
ncbi:MAG: hypothetical protein IKT78_02290, partial [Ruminiclostridium sp.]|nr:hypothetical protein [Ruminiclostridium sp.]